MDVYSSPINRSRRLVDYVAYPQTLVLMSDQTLASWTGKTVIKCMVRLYFNVLRSWGDA